MCIYIYIFNFCGQDSKIDIYSRMWVSMNTDPSNFVPSNAVGLNRVLKDNGSVEESSTSICPISPSRMWIRT